MARLDRSIKSGNYGFEYSGGELSGKTIGIVGMGHIGKEVARLATAFEMKVLGYHRHPIDTGLGFESTDFETLLQMSDIVSINVRLTSQTRHMIGQHQLEIMKSNAFFVNTARGAVVDETALVKALRTGKIGGAGLDVFEKEPTPMDNLLLTLDNIVVAPHVSSASHETRSRMAEMVAENLIAFFEGRTPPNLVNSEVLKVRPLSKQS